MNAIANLLCVIDPVSETQPALGRAAWLARHVGAHLELLVCYYNEYLAGVRYHDADSLQRLRDNVMQDQRTRLEALAEPLRKEGLQVTTRVTWDFPLYDGVVRHAARINADIVFKDTHHHWAISRGVFSNTDWNLIRNCASPLWFVKPQPLAARPVFLAAIDPMHENDKPASLDDKILRTAAALSAATEGEMHAFHAYDPRFALTAVVDNAYVPVPLLSEEVEKDMRERHQARFRELTEFHGVPEDRAHLVAGVTSQELPVLATDLEAAVVVMGAVSRTRIKRLFIGSTAERTLEHLPCDLLVVKPDWYRAPAAALEEPAA